MRRLSAISMLCVLVLQAQSLAVQYSARARASSRSDLDKRLKAAFADGVAHPPGVHNCAQMPAGHVRAHGPERFTLAECRALQELQRAAPARSSFVHDLTWDEQVLPLLPPQLAITVSDEAGRAADEAAQHGRSWVDQDPSAAASKKSQDEIEVTGNSFREVLVLWGRGDFDGKGTEELLVQSLDTLTEGTYRNTRLFILTRRTPTGPLSVVRSLL